MTLRAAEQASGDVELLPDDLFVKSLAVQGGEAEIAGEKTAFARIVLTGVELRHSDRAGAGPTRRDAAVLTLQHAASFAAELGEVMDNMVHRDPHPDRPFLRDLVMDARAS